MTNDTLAARLARIEARTEIEELKTRYVNECDTGYDGQRIAELFTLDGSWGSNTIETVTGQTAIANLMTSIGREQFSWATHFLSNSSIHLAENGIEAHAHWDLLQMASRGQTSVLAVGKYTDHFKREGGAWKFGSVRVHFRFIGTLAEGWHQGARGFLTNAT